MLLSADNYQCSTKQKATQTSSPIGILLSKRLNFHHDVCTSTSRVRLELVDLLVGEIVDLRVQTGGNIFLASNIIDDWARK
jgi:hypothetical protein